MQKDRKNTEDFTDKAKYLENGQHFDFSNKREDKSSTFAMIMEEKVSLHQKSLKYNARNVQYAHVNPSTSNEQGNSLGPLRKNNPERHISYA